MGAISGIYNPGGKPAAGGALLSALAHRGRTSRSWTEGAVTLGQVAGTPAEADIVRHEPTGVVVVADGRIDNADAPGPTGTDGSAASAILQAYLRWGERCANELIGDFAFAIWDPRLNALLLARDPMGVKPVYWYADAQTFAFATDPRALLRLPFVDAGVDEVQVALFLLWEQADRQRTLFQRIRRLPGGCTLRVDANGVREREYWRPGNDPAVRLGSADAYAEAFRETFFEAVRVRACGASIAAALSGGVDSSAIVCVARELHRAGKAAPVEAYSVIFPGLPAEDLKRIDERHYVDAVERASGARTHRIRGDEISPLCWLDDMLSALAEPHSAPNLYLHWGMYRAAAERGAEVFLDGFDGDSAVSHGLGRLGSLATLQEWNSFEHEVRAFAKHREIAPEAVLLHYGLPQLAELAAGGRWLRWALSYRELTKRFRLSRSQVLLERGVRPVLGRLRRRGVMLGPDGELLRPELRRRVADQLQRDPEPALDPEMERSAHVRSLSQAGYQLVLELADQAAAAFGLTPRYPYFDRRLIALCLSLPAEYKFADGWTRLTMRRALRGVVPDEVLWRMSKSNLSPNFYRRLRTDRDVIATTDFGILDSYVDLRKLEAKRARYLTGTGPRADEDAMLLFRTTVLARWLAREGSVSPTIEAPRASHGRPRHERLRVLRR